MNFRHWLLGLALLLVGSASALAQQTVTVGSGTGNAGGTSSAVTLSYNDGGTPSRSLQFDVTFDPTKLTPNLANCVATIAAAGLDFALPPSCRLRPAPNNNQFRVVIALNTGSIPNGQLGTVTFAIAAGAAAGPTPLTVGNIVVETGTATGVNGQVTIATGGGGNTPAVTITATDPNASEAGAATGQFTVTATPAPTAALTVNLTLAGTATNGTDYTTIPATVSVPTSGSATITVTPIDDATVETGGETVVATVSAGTGYTVGTPSSATVTIADNDGGGGGGNTLTITAADPQACEPDDPTTDGTCGTASFSVSRSGSTAAALTVNLTYAGSAQSGVDYTALPATVTIPAGATSSAPIIVTALADTTEEGPENIAITAAATGLTSATSTIFILASDQPTGPTTPAVPAISEWGVLLLGMLMLITLVVRSQRRGNPRK